MYYESVNKCPGILNNVAKTLSLFFFFSLFFLSMIDIKLQDYTKNKKDKTKDYTLTLSTSS